MRFLENLEAVVNDLYKALETSLFYFKYPGVFSEIFHLLSFKEYFHILQKKVTRIIYLPVSTPRLFSVVTTLFRRQNDVVCLLERVNDLYFRSIEEHNQTIKDSNCRIP